MLLYVPIAKHGYSPSVLTKIKKTTDNICIKYMKKRAPVSFYKFLKYFCCNLVMEVLGGP
jgi:hypothetical protein